MLMHVLQSMNLSQFAGKHLKVAQLYQALFGLVTLEEVKAIKLFMAEERRASDDAVDDLASHPDYIDMDDLIDMVRLKSQLMSGGAAAGSHSGATSAEVDSLNRKLARVIREKDDDAEFFSAKVR